MLRSQIVLMVLMGLYAIYIVRLRSTVGDRIIYLSLAFAGGILVLRPDWSNQLAARLSIGRGADLMLYFFVVFSLFHFATTASTIRKLQRDIGTLTRALAIREPVVKQAEVSRPST